MTISIIQAEMETRRKHEEIERLRLEEEDRRAALVLQAQLEKEAQEDTQYRQQLEQERRDHELALRLALESNGQIEESPTMSRKYVEKNNFEIFSVVRFLYKEEISCKYSRWIVHASLKLKILVEHKFSVFLLQWYTGLGIKQSQPTHQVCYTFPNPECSCSNC